MDVRELTTTAELHAASNLLAAIWPPTDPMPYEMLRVIQHIGGYLGGAYDEDRLIGACAAFPTADGGLHSHITGVTAPGRGVGFAIKLHQREWALAHDMTPISWTYDPLVRRNAVFNLGKLGARVTGYFEDFYGEMPDELNAGDPSDRFLVAWDLAAPEVAAAVAGETTVPAEPGPEVSVVLTADPGGRPLRRTAADATRLAIGTPADIAALRGADPALAGEWRRAQRSAIDEALGAGFGVVGITRSGHYLLEVGQ